MQKHAITTVISYCTNDYRFIKKCISEAQIFSDQIIVPVCDHFFDGSKENKKLLNLTYFENPQAQFIEYKFYKNKLYYPYKTCRPQSIDWQHIMHSTSRYISYFFLNENTEYILFLDADEILDGRSFKKWLGEFDYKKFTALRLGGYDYFRYPDVRMEYLNYTSLLVNKTALDPLLLMEEGERRATFNLMSGKKNPLALLGKKPMVHHYSWVRTKEEMIKKTETWGHFKDKNWKQLIEEEFAKEHCDYNFFDIKLVKKALYFDPLKVSSDFNVKMPRYFKNVNKIDRLDILKKQLR